MNKETPIKVFISYSHSDKAYFKYFKKYLKYYEKNNKIVIWDDTNIIAGQPWDDIIKYNLNASEVLLFLISEKFLASKYINDVEIKSALQKNGLSIIPVLIENVTSHNFALMQYQALPTGAKPVKSWSPQSDAWFDIIDSLEPVFESLRMSTSREKTSEEKDWSLVIVKWSFAVFILLCLGIFSSGIFNGDSFLIIVSLIGFTIGGLLLIYLNKKNLIFA